MTQKKSGNPTGTRKRMLHPWELETGGPVLFETRSKAVSHKNKMESQTGLKHRVVKGEIDVFDDDYIVLGKVPCYSVHLVTPIQKVKRAR